MNQETEQLTFHYIIRHVDLTEKCRYEFFSLKYIGELFKIVKPHVLQYQSCPTAQQTIQLVKIADISDELREYFKPDIIFNFWKMGDTLTSYEEHWLENTAHAFISWNTLIYGLKNALAYVKTVESDVNIDNFQDLVNGARNRLTQDTAVEFVNTTQGVSLYNPQAHKTKELNRWTTGYKFLDRGSKGGYWAGSLWVFLGAPKAGKSRLLQNLAAEAIKQGHNCAYASFELQEEIITQRVGANLFSIPMDDYDRYANDENVMNEKIRSFIDPTGIGMGSQKGELDIKAFPTSAFSVQDLELWLLKEEERLTQETGKEFHFKNIYVDYLNIMKNWRNPNSENTYMKIKQIAEDLRAMAMKNKWCVITATQVKQSFFNAGDIDMTSASESSALAATVDFMGGIITDIFMQASHCLMLKTILSRVTPHINERKKFNIEECYMRLVDAGEDIIHDEDLTEDFVEQGKNIIKNYKNGNNGGGNSQKVTSTGTKVKPSQLPPSERPKPYIEQTPTPVFSDSGMSINKTYSTNISSNLSVTETRVTGEGMF